MRRNLALSFFSVFLYFPGLGVAYENCSTGCEDVLIHAPFTDTKVSFNASSKESFRSLQCAAHWSNAQEALSAGIEATVPIYDLEIPFTTHWDNTKVNQWKDTNCSESERKSDYVVALSIALHEVDPSGVPAWTQCIQVKCSRPESLNCGQQSSGDIASFKARWNQGMGEPESSAPKVQIFQAFNASCTDPPAKDSKIQAGGNIVSCKLKSKDDDAVFVLQTDRGSCIESVQVDKYDRVLQGVQTLTQPTLINTDRLSLRDGLVVFTNGNDLSITAQRIDVEGMPKIIAFDSARKDRPAAEQGRPAGKVTIEAKEIRGGTLRIENFGEVGSQGATGIQGVGGPGGARGSPRSVNFAGCSPGTDGEPGGVGGTGGAGGTGGTGGAGGRVEYKIEKGLGDGLVKRIDVRSSFVNRHNQVVACNGVCGGEGGVGGMGGAGGPGGPGGNGAGGSSVCGGTNAGPPGPVGAVGVPGSEGQTGPSGEIVISQ